jgi:integrase
MENPRRQSPFLEEVRSAIRVRHYSIRTEDAYLAWIKRFIVFHGKRHPKDMGEVEVGAFLSHLPVQGNVAPSTQNQALNALVFLYKAVPERPLQEIGGVVRAKKPQKLPVVLTPQEVKEVLRHLQGSHWLIGCLLFGSGLRLMEAVRLRVKDLDFDHRAILVRNGKGGKDRVVTFPDVVITPITQHLQRVKMLHEKDVADGYGEVYLPYALARKYPRNTRARPGSGIGSMYFPPAAAVRIGAPVSYAAIISTRAACRRRSGRRCARPGSGSRRRAIPFGIPSPRRCSSAAWTSVPCRNNSVTRMSELPRSIPTCSNVEPTAC